jgi:hypothetical protein
MVVRRHQPGQGTEKTLLYAVPRHREVVMAVEDDDIPLSFLLYAITAIAVMIGIMIVGGFFLWVR